MKKRYPIHDGSSLLSNSRWLAYAAAGTALGGATSAEAEIHYSGVLNMKFNGSSESDHLALDNGASLFFRHVEDLAEYVFSTFSPSAEGSQIRLGVESVVPSSRGLTGSISVSAFRTASSLA